MNTIPKSEYPRPQMVRDSYICLNGKWEFEIDNTNSGVKAKYFERSHLDDEIVVPFAPESELSGIGYKNFMKQVWYRRDLEISSEMKEKRIILHFGAVDYEAHIYINGTEVGIHKGGYTPFSFDITEFVVVGCNSICVLAIDDTRSGKQPTGKQSEKKKSYGCLYTRTTGIWQTVWLELVDNAYITSYKVYPNISNSSVTLHIKTNNAKNETLLANVTYNGKFMGEAKTVVNSTETVITIELNEKHLWEVGNGRLYDLQLSLSSGDKVDCYFGLREVNLTNKGIEINGKIVFGRFILDQGFFPDGIYTAPTDDRLRQDILDGISLGFNGARMHEKIFEPRYLYWADKLGYMVWGEHANWGMDVSKGESVNWFLPEWIESMERDFNHPSLIGWCPFNETWDYKGKRQCDDVLSTVYKMTKALDPTRPCIDTSGNFHVITDIFDVHDYEQQPDEFYKNYAQIKDGIITDGISRNPKFCNRQKYPKGEPLFVSEYGGIKWDCEQDISSWGYGESVKTEEEFIERYKGLTDVLLDNEMIMGFCYTQLTDVEQEKNGLLTYDRKFKFDAEIIKKITSRKAKIEE